MQLFQISWFVTLIVPTSNAIFRLPCLPLKGGGGGGIVKLGTVRNGLRFLEFNMLIVIKMWMMLAKFLRSMNEITHLKKLTLKFGRHVSGTPYIMSFRMNTSDED